MGYTQRVGEAAKYFMDRSVHGFTGDVPQGNIYGAFGNLIINGPMHDCPNLFPVEWVQPNNLRGENLFNDIFYGNLSLTIGVWTRWSVRDAGDPLIGMYFEANVLCGMYFS